MRHLKSLLFILLITVMLATLPPFSPASGADSCFNAPPILYLAIRVGNPVAIKRTILTLSASNPALTAQLALLVAQCAVVLQKTDPRTASASFDVARSFAQDPAVCAAAPSTCQQILSAVSQQLNPYH